MKANAQNVEKPSAQTLKAASLSAIAGNTAQPVEQK
jgi:hypothetical protein